MIHHNLIDETDLVGILHGNGEVTTQLLLQERHVKRRRCNHNVYNAVSQRKSFKYVRHREGNKRFECVSSRYICYLTHILWHSGIAPCSSKILDGLLTAIHLPVSTNKETTSHLDAVVLLSTGPMSAGEGILLGFAWNVSNIKVKQNQFSSKNFLAFLFKFCLMHFRPQRNDWLSIYSSHLRQPIYTI